MNIQLEKNILELIYKKYNRQDFPCLYDQYIRFKSEKPYEGLKILNSTPIFQNFLPKILPLLASNAELVIKPPYFIDSSDNEIQLLKSLGLRVIESIPDNEKLDYVLDCCGENAGLEARGFVELTKSGEDVYNKSGKKFINVDNSKCKEAEDFFGTSDSLIRAAKKLEILDSLAAKVLILGFGKVGRGVFKALSQISFSLKVFDPYSPDRNTDIFLENINEIEAFNPDVVITATGVENVIEKNGMTNFILKNRRMLINLGALDEYGPLISSTSVLNNKKPLNFILQEPTRLKFLDPTFALQNESLKVLIESNNKGRHIVCQNHDSLNLKISGFVL